MAKRLTREEVAHVALLARLEVTEAELDMFTEQLADILGHADEIEALDVSDVEAMAHPLGLTNVLRDDVVVPSLDRDEVLAQAPAAEDGRFRVPRILGEAP
jgi:aspartyl-tRNA(Asn)/glutamyl-tRNA(Gln) amidotransferase subunit C